MIVFLDFPVQSARVVSLVVAKKIIYRIILCAVRCEALKFQFEESSKQDVKKEFEELKQGYRKLKASIILLSCFFVSCDLC